MSSGGHGQSHCIMSRVEGDVIYLLGLCFLASIVGAQAIGCNVTLNANGTTTYLISKPPLPGCPFYWTDENKTVLANEEDYALKQVVSQTHVSLTTKDCHKHLHYIADCDDKGGGTLEAQCMSPCAFKEVEQACDGINCHGKNISIPVCILIFILISVSLGYCYRKRLYGFCHIIKQKGWACCCPEAPHNERVESPSCCLYIPVKKEEPFNEEGSGDL